MLATLLIVFREVLEAGLIVGIVLAATKGVVRRGLWIAGGIAGGLLGAALVAVFAGELSSLFQGSGQELFNAGVLLLAVVMLGWHNVWMASHGRAIAREMRAVGGAVAEGRRPMTALAIVVGVAVLREGAEVVLFLYGIAGSGGTSAASMLADAWLGILGGGAMAGLIYGGLLAIPVNRLFAATSSLIALLAAGMAAQAVLFLQQGGYLETMSTPLWDSSWLLSQESIPGRMLHTLVGYSDSPDGAQLIAYAFTIAVIAILMRLLRPNRRATGNLSADTA
ncbi:MAG: FTR1 family protein [Acidobacteriia bacterium]|nr:FTR1 family protein [Terriglobia bacterium]